MSTVDTTKLHKAAVDIVRIAVAVGWTAHNTVNSGVYLSSPVDHTVVIQLPANGQLRDRVARSWMTKVLRYGDPDKVLKLQLSKDIVQTAQRDPAFAADNSRTKLSMVAPGTPLSDNNEVPAVDDPEPEPQQKLRIISETPWIARRRTTDETGRGYESGAVIERQWSDGTRDYACSWPGCDYTNALPVSVARHYGRSKDHVQPAKPGREQVIEKYEPRHRPDNREARIKRLLAELEAASDLLDPGWSLQDLAERVIERRDARHVMHEDDAGEPVTAEQMLERIRLMIDDGTFARRAEQMTKQQVEIESLSSEVAHLNELVTASERNAKAAIEAASELAEQRDAARAEAEKFRSDWTALAELINSGRTQA